ncbi:MAG TPA: hypothetical protein VGI45_11340 [Terracidiphilus sp.]
MAFDCADTTFLKRDQRLVGAFNFFFGVEEFLAPWSAGALGAFVDRIADGVTVVAGSFGAVAGELVARLAGLEELAFERPVLVP